MPLVVVSCDRCGKVFLRSRRQINESKKWKWRSFCSPRCLSLFRYKQKQYVCGNPDCSKTITRSPTLKTLSGSFYCSKSCSAIVSNKSRTYEPTIKRCPQCQEEFTGRRKYCSTECQPKTQPIKKELILKEIRSFYEKHGRIPLKKEYWHAKAARLRFGTWNRAVVATGFKPNKEIFTNKRLADDGHTVDSWSEKIIDDYLFTKKIKHKINYPYPGNKPFTVDFKIGEYWVEFFGLTGQLKKYDQLKRKKEMIARKHGLKLIKIYPKDLFPKSKLDKIFTFLNKHANNA